MIGGLDEDRWAIAPIIVEGYVPDLSDKGGTDDSKRYADRLRESESEDQAARTEKGRVSHYSRIVHGRSHSGKSTDQ